MERILRKAYGRLRELMGRLPPPFDAAQEYVETRLHEYLRCAPGEVGRVLVVGGFQADEVVRMLPRYSAAHFAVFEPSREQIGALTKRFAAKDRVTVVNAAAGRVPGRATFFEADAPGNGSLLQLGDSAKTDFGLSATESYEVDVVTLDDWCLQRPPWAGTIDLLWCDVQGAEADVLAGASAVIGRARAVFLEVSVRDRVYQGNALSRELDQVLRPRGFEPVLMGLDPSTLTGNALWLRLE